MNLFCAHGPVDSVRVRGPMALAAPGERTLPAGGSYRVFMKGGLLHLCLLDRDRQVPMAGGRRLVLKALSGRGITIERPDGLVRRYSGSIVVSMRENRLNLVNLVPRVDYVRSVVASELPISFHREARKALAVLTLCRLDNCQGVVDDTTEYEAYKGLDPITPVTEDAVAKVFRQRLRFKNRTIRAFYHSTCAGSTSDGREIFGKGAASLDYLQSVPCSFCRQSPFFDTRSTRIPVKKVREIFGGALPVVTEKGSGDRPLLITLMSKNGSAGKVLSGYQTWLAFGRSLGWGRIPGTRYEIEPVSVRGNAGEGYLDVRYLEVRSSGAGHGVGLCQWGAQGQALAGRDYREILHYYFPAAELYDIFVP
ncbi:MAG: SpoIID/LytB domain-containing protein [Candidatus Obscuribacterales bacterium]